MGLSVAARWQVRVGTAVWVSGRSESLGPSGTRRLFTGISPTGSRTAQSLTFGVTVGGDLAAAR
jgi:hypothetical protein